MSEEAKKFHEEEAIEKTYDWSVTRRLLRYVKPYWRIAAGALPLKALDKNGSGLLDQGDLLWLAELRGAGVETYEIGGTDYEVDFLLLLLSANWMVEVP